MRPEMSGDKARAVSKTPQKVPPNAKKARAAAEALGFECFTENRMTHKPATLRKKATDEHAAGSVLYPAKDIDTHYLQGRHLVLPTGLAFQAVWGDGFSGRIVDESGGKPVELKADYFYGPGARDAYGYTPEYVEKVGQERTYRYNDGEVYYLSRWRVASWGEFTAWIDGLIDALKVDYPHISTKRKPTKKKTEEDIMYELLNPKVDYGEE